MKNKIIVAILFVFSSIALAQDSLVFDNIVTVSTNSTTIANKRVNRCYFLAVNTDGSNVVWTSTQPINKDTYLSKKSFPISTNYGHYEDAYFVYTSTWYACTTTSTAVIAVREKE